MAVSIVVVAMGTGVTVVRERNEMLQEPRARGATIVKESDPDIRLFQSAGNVRGLVDPPTVLPFWRRWLGDEAVYSVELSEATINNRDVDRIQATFPEATVK